MTCSSRIISKKTPQICSIGTMELQTHVINTFAECYLGAVT